MVIINMMVTTIVNALVHISRELRRELGGSHEKKNRSQRVKLHGDSRKGIVTV